MNAPLPAEFASLVDVARLRASDTGDAKGYTFLGGSLEEGERLGYATLDRRARAVAMHLRGRAEPGSRALICCAPGTDYVAAFFGCLYGGMVAVPVYPPHSARDHDRLRGIAGDCGASAVLTRAHDVEATSAWVSGAQLGKVAVVGVDGVADGPADAWSPPQLTSESLALLQYTSGSTGQPKGVMVTHGNLLHNLRQMQEAFGQDPESCVVSWLPPFHDMGLIGTILQPLFCGGRAYLMSPLTFVKSPMRWLQAISRFGGTTSGGPNFAYELCLSRAAQEDLESLDLSRWKVAFNGAETVRAATLERFAEVFSRCGFRRDALHPCYGLAEATLLVTSKAQSRDVRVDEVDPAALEEGRVRREGAAPARRRIVGCGVPRDAEVRIVTPEGRACAPDEIGEVWVHGRSIASGYWKKPEETERTFGARVAAEPGGRPYMRTGDLGYLHQGELFVTGRAKDLVIINGRNLYPADLELTVSRSDDRFRPDSGAAFSVFEGDREQLVVVQEVRRAAPGGAPGGAAWDGVLSRIRADVNAEHGVQVSSIVLIKAGSLPKTTSGKVQRYRARAQFLSGALEELARWSAKAGGAAEEEPGAWSAPAEGESARAQQLRRLIAGACGLPPSALRSDVSFHDLGLDSLALIGLAGAFEQALGTPVSPTAFYNYPTVGALIEEMTTGGAKVTADVAGEQCEPIAIVGIGCRFPGNVDGPEAYWRFLQEKGQAVGDIPQGRWDAGAYFDPDPGRAGKMYTRRMASLEGVDQFDPSLFGISPREAEYLDPQQRLLLEVTWEALEDSLRSPLSLARSRTGVFVGICGSDFARLTTSADRIGVYSGTGAAASTASGRLSYFLGLRGPSLSIDTACSSSLVALHLACESLRSKESTCALAGGVNLILSPEGSIALCKLRALSPSGVCSTFGADADGYVRGEGCGMVVLKRLADARRDGDRIWAVIRSSAVNHDGQTNGLTAPSGIAQQLVIATALQRAGAQPDQIGYVEAHGTGTRLGDPIELEALGAVLGRRAGRADPLLVGSVKSNFGHLEAAAGIAGVIKAALIAHHAQVPPNVGPVKKSAHVSWEALGLDVAQQPVPLSAGRRLVGISSFGMGGTNAHAILGAPDEAEPRREARPAAGPPYLLVLSARTEKSLRRLAAKYVDFFQRHPGVDLEEVCAAAAAGRAHLEHRLAVLAGKGDELRDVLERFSWSADDLARPGTGAWHGAPAARRTLRFVIPEAPPRFERLQGLASEDDRFRQALAEGEAAVRRVAGCALRELCEGGEGEGAKTRRRMAAHVTAYALWRAALGSGLGGASGWGADPGAAPPAWLGGGAALEQMLASIASPPRPKRIEPIPGPEAGGAAHWDVELAIPEDGAGARACVLRTLAQAYAAGAGVAWRTVMGERGRTSPLPTYAFDRQRLWPELAGSPSAPPRASGLGALAPCELDAPLAAFEVSCSTETERWLADHQVGAAAIFPATGFLWLAQRAWQQMGGAEGELSLEIHQPLPLGPAPVAVQILCESLGAPPRFFISSRKAGANGRNAWERHASGAWIAGAPASQAPAPSSLDELRRRQATQLPPEQLYALLAGAGLRYGPAFRVIRSASGSAMEAVGRLEDASGPAAGAEGALSPTLLDGALQLLAVPDRVRELGQVFLPISIRRYRQLRPHDGRGIWAHAKLVEVSDLGLTADLTLLDDGGALLAELHGVKAMRAAGAALGISGARPPAEKTPGGKGSWLPALAGATTSQRRERLLERLIPLVRESARIPQDQELTAQTPFEDVGVDSLAAVEIVEEVTIATGISVPTNMILDIFCLDDLTDRLMGLLEERYPAQGAAGAHGE